MTQPTPGAAGADVPPEAPLSLEALIVERPDEQANEADIHACYRLLLGRTPGEAGLENYRRLIRERFPRARLVRSFLNSPEFETRADPDLRARAHALYRKVHGHHASVGSLRWFHSIRLPDGTITDGLRNHAQLCREAEAIFAPGVAGRSVLDIGAWDGFFSFEAERRGAASVMSTDHFCWSGPGWGTKTGYDTAHAALGSRADSLDVDVFDLDPEVQGRFDVVLFLGVLYHLKNPYGGLEQAARMSRDLLVVETVTACNDIDRPVMQHFPGTEMNNDSTNFFAPNVACLTSILGELGFARIEVHRNPVLLDDTAADDAPPLVRTRDRHIVHAWR